MKRALLFALLLSACREEAAQATDPVALTADAVGHFCQMNLLEHEGPKAQVHLEGLPGTPLFFSQVRDAVTYARLPEQSHPILAIWVNDMGASGATWAEPGADNWIDAKTAHFVVGSRLAGGMGAPEFVPFARMEDATAFALRNGGSIMGLDAIPDAAVIAPEAEAIADDTDFTRRLKALSERAGG
ncbi:MAG: nitrous oxide reductase accessory protein NosL [Rhodobacteraceae bacterium]|jgi:copper chaperone NosL|uniref:nitrous oxide reductase accessory protein NosL n=1 Tax=Albidovulum sp. TaxID=1872424 RepID=UPI001DC7E077|nr:nitrous oxide reductase accessory protein NosL [uncultured Defluviimonas sp.]MCB2125745.1 nitrous oxide reductase accessory protein NosL [Paracoccaceae bacterium]MCC0069813.1 nitrous oxide reductase accessory protein NosL [Paracoccaceae bacterium]